MIIVLRIGHRPQRDKRITTHVALAARALGADSVLVDRRDKELERTFEGVSERFGGDVELRTGVKWREELRNWQGQVVHLTMYGEEFSNGMAKVDRGSDVMVVVGAEKVPAELYELADVNLSAGNQPHSEVAALALFLNAYFQGQPFRDFEDGSMRIIPDARGKRVEEND